MTSQFGNPVMRVWVYLRIIAVPLRYQNLMDISHGLVYPKTQDFDPLSFEAWLESLFDMSMITHAMCKARHNYSPSSSYRRHCHSNGIGVKGIHWEGKVYSHPTFSKKGQQTPKLSETVVGNIHQILIAQWYGYYPEIDPDSHDRVPKLGCHESMGFSETSFMYRLRAPVSREYASSRPLLYLKSLGLLPRQHLFFP
ncbi:hypothetical protein C8R43DRAFT_1103345 [Mycena crocata]|nr:hypothetical protein C8R43DRAFT_1103345 [Mycena crocata]